MNKKRDNNNAIMFHGYYGHYYMIMALSTIQQATLCLHWVSMSDSQQSHLASPTLRTLAECRGRFCLLYVYTHTHRALRPCKCSPTAADNYMQAYTLSQKQDLQWITFSNNSDNYDEISIIFVISLKCICCLRDLLTRSLAAARRSCDAWVIFGH